jgi:GNAT superfamily N-acetyltransferase
MGNIYTKQFQILTDINLVWDFMVDVYNHQFSNGVAAPFFEYAITSTWMNKSYLHLNRLWLDDGKVVGFVFTEEPVTKVFFNLHPEYESLAYEMIQYAEDNIPDFDGEREFVIFSGQRALSQVVEKRGYIISFENVDMALDLNKSELNYQLPSGFHFVDSLKADPLKLAICTWKGFNHEDKGNFDNWDDRDPGTVWNPQKAYNGILSSTIAPPPHATYEYNVIIANKKEEYVCFSGMWWVSPNHLAYMEPLCTIPEYRSKGLAAAALSEHYRRLKPLGAQMMTGGGNDFYKKIGYDLEIHWMHWKKQLTR